MERIRVGAGLLVSARGLYRRVPERQRVEIGRQAFAVFGALRLRPVVQTLASQAELLQRLTLDLHHDRPGIVGRMGLILGEAGINISFVQMSRAQRGGAQIMILGLDEPVSSALLPRFQEVPNVQRVRAISLPPLNSFSG